MLGKRGPTVIAYFIFIDSLFFRPFLEAIFSSLDCSENDHAALFALCVLYALGYNPGIYNNSFIFLSLYWNLLICLCISSEKKFNKLKLFLISIMKSFGIMLGSYKNNLFLSQNSEIIDKK